jgi:tRNA 2-thiouridine synthesizing protein A
MLRIRLAKASSERRAGIVLCPLRKAITPSHCREQLKSSSTWLLAQSPGRTHLTGMSETLLDVKGMNCPLPVLKANRALRGMAAGERLRVLATDRAAVADFQAFCRETGHALLAWSDEAGVFSFVIRRRAEDPEKEGS